MRWAVRWALLETPIGPVAIGADPEAVRGLQLRPRGTGVGAPPAGSLLAEAVDQLRAYFAGQRTRFDLPVSIPDGQGSEFERAVWAELARIPYGQMRTYGAVAAAVGDGGAARAVGTACHRNPYRWSCPATGWSARAASWSGSGAGCPASAGCWSTRPGSAWNAPGPDRRRRPAAMATGGDAAVPALPRSPR